MKKFWSYIAVAFGTAFLTLAAAIKYLLPETTVYKGQFKMKQRGKGNTQNTDLTLETGSQTKRDERKQAKIIAKNEKKAAKSAKRLQKRL